MIATRSLVALNRFINKRVFLSARLSTRATAVMASEKDWPRVLSIQSHVVHGYVGNKCAVLTLQLLGLEVDPVNSVQFSNHAGYPSFRGARFDGDHLQDLLEGLEENGITSYTHLLTGYVGSVSLLRKVAAVCLKLREWNKDLTYVCDPVLGDEGKLYVPQELVEVYKTEILPLASIIMPNQYEAELLSGHSINSLEEGFEACRQLHNKGPHTVVLTSTVLPQSPNHITLIASTTRSQKQGEAMKQLVLTIPRITAYFTGTGDLLAALLLGRLHKHPEDLGLAIDEAIAALQAVLYNTAESCGDACSQSSKLTSEMSNKKELRLVQNQHHIVHPVINIRCKSWEEHLQCLSNTSSVVPTGAGVL